MNVFPHILKNIFFNRRVTLNSLLNLPKTNYMHSNLSNRNNINVCIEVIGLKWKLDVPPNKIKHRPHGTTNTRVSAPWRAPTTKPSC